MLAVIYITLTAAPLSLRRLLLLFIVALASANVVFALFHAKHAPNAALVTAAAVTLLAWSMPLARLVYDGIRFRMVPMDTLGRVSGFIRWTYGFALALVPMVAITAMIHPTHQVAFVDLLRLSAAAGLLGAVLERGFSTWNQRRHC